ncbi:hypothetical protein NESM_000904800 [Novymonas esmeraldas]|uniref:Uncharacterized protein n=1 Tax=Novymonas esmeraldas TaxID=1808958 RepID=A0AAW0F142_9TRYP
MYSAVQDIEELGRTHLPMREDAYRPIEERQKILALMEGTMVAQVLTFMKPHRIGTMCAVSPTVRVYAELVHFQSIRVPYEMCLSNRLVHRFSGELEYDHEKERLRHHAWWIAKCGLPLHLDHSSAWTVLRAIAPALVAMVRSSPLSADGDPPELQVSDILQLEEMCIRGDWAILIANVTPSQLTHLRRLTVEAYTSEVCENFLLQLPGLTELSIHDADETPVSLMEPAYAARLLRLTIRNPAMTTLSWIYTCTSVTHLSIIRCSFVLDLRSLIELPHLTSLDMSGSNVPHLDGLSRCLTLTRIFVRCCSQLLSLEGLVGAPQLLSIDASYSGVQTLGELHRCPSLTTVHFENCSHLRSIEGLAGVLQLEEVYLGGTKVTDITPLTASLRNLKKLVLWNSGVTSIAAIAGATQLEVVDLRGTKVTDITPLTASLSTLKKLYLASSRVTSIDAIYGAKQLQLVDLTGTKVTDTSMLPRSTRVLS